MNNSSTYSVSNGSFSLASIVIESLSSTTFSGLSSPNISYSFVYSITLSGLTCLNIVNCSISFISVVHLWVEYNNSNVSFDLASKVIASLSSTSFSGFCIPLIDKVFISERIVIH